MLDGETIKTVFSAFAAVVGLCAFFVAIRSVKQATIARRASTINSMLSHISQPGFREIRKKIVDKDLSGGLLTDEERRKLINAYDRCALIAADDEILQARLLNFQSDTISAIMTEEIGFIDTRRNSGHEDYVRHLEELWEWGKRNQKFRKSWNTKWPTPTVKG